MPSRFFSWFHFGTSRHYSFRLSILILFLSLFIVSSACIIGFTYSHNYRSLLAYVKDISSKTTVLISTRFNMIAMSCQRVTELGAGFFPAIGPLNQDNPLLRTYLLTVVKENASIQSIYIGFPNGVGFCAMSVSPQVQPYLLSKPFEELPSNVRFSWIFAQPLEDGQSGDTAMTWHYLDENLQTVTSEIVSPFAFNLTHRPWYQDAAVTGETSWTDFYKMIPSEKKAISVGTPMYENGQIAAIVGADLTLDIISSFLRKEQVGHLGKVCIVDHRGNIVVPDLDDPRITPELVSQAHEHFVKHPDATDFIFTSKGERYLCFISNLPAPFGTQWTVMVLAPLADFLGLVVQRQNETLLFMFLVMLLSSAVIIYCSRKIASPIGVLASEIRKIEECDLSSTVRVNSKITEIARLDEAMAAMRRVVQSFAKYVPKRIVKKLFLMKKPISIGGEKKEITVFFSDITQFTTIVESYSIDVLLPLLTEYFEMMSAVIRGEGGIIDKFIGDQIMAFWGAPDEMEEHTRHACNAALLCHAKLTSFNEARAQAGKPEFPTRFGIHVGSVIVGNIGTHDRFNYTMIGDVVNTTARLQALAKFYQTAIIVSQEVRAQLGPHYLLRPLDVVTVKGKRLNTKIYELVGKEGDQEEIRPSHEQTVLCTEFTEAYQAFEENDKQRAKVLFSQLAERYPHDFPTQLYLTRLNTPDDQ